MCKGVKMPQIRVRLYGSIPEQKTLDKIKCLRGGAFLDEDGRWLCKDPPDRNISTIHPILSIDTSNCIATSQMSYDVRGWAHLSASDTSIFTENCFRIDIRYALTVHFYASFLVEVEINDLIKPNAEGAIDNAIDSLAEIGLMTEECVVESKLPQDDYESAVGYLCDSFSDAVYSGGGDYFVMLIDDLRVRHVVMLTSGNRWRAIDGSIWYKYWQACVARREVLKYANSLAGEISPLLGKVKLISGLPGYRRREIEDLLEVQIEIMLALDRLRSFGVMLMIIRLYRNNIGEVRDEALSGSLILPTEFSDLNKKLSEEEWRLYDSPIAAVAAAIEELTGAAESRIVRIDGIQQTRFNFTMQRRLLVLQILAIIIAAYGIIVTHVGLWI